MTDKFLSRIDEIAYRIGNKFEKLNIAILKKPASQIKEIKSKKPKNISLVYEQGKAYDNIRESKDLIMAFCIGLFDEISDELNNYAKTVYDTQDDIIKTVDLPKEYAVPYEDNHTAQEITRNAVNLTRNSFINIANTSVMSQEYISAIDKAVAAVTNGEDFDKVMSSTINELSNKFTRVTYASGITRRLDSAARMNIYEGARRIQRQLDYEQAKRLGMDAVVISAHADCAPDHLEIQGQKFSLSEFDEINSTLHRPIGTLNCRHYEMYTFSYLDNPYSAEYVQALHDRSLETIDINGKKVTRYKAEQMARALETRMRYTLDRIQMSQQASNDINAEAQKSVFESQKAAYVKLCSQIGIRPDYRRIFVKGVDNYGYK